MENLKNHKKQRQFKFRIYEIPVCVFTLAVLQKSFY